MAQALELVPDDRVLEVGAGSGYAAAVLGRLAARVDAVEVRDSLARRAAENLAAAGVANVAVHAGDGTAGWPAAAPPTTPSRWPPAGRRSRPPWSSSWPRAAAWSCRSAAGPSASAWCGCAAARGGDDRLEDLGIPVRFVPLVSGD